MGTEARKRKPRPVPIPLAARTRCRRFVLVRAVDVSGTSGVGVVAEGVRLSNGQAILHWLTQLSSVGVYHSTDILISIHGHSGATVLEWIDDEPNKKENSDEKHEKSE